MNAVTLTRGAEPLPADIAEQVLAEAIAEPAFTSLEEAFAAIDAGAPEIERLRVLHNEADEAWVRRNRDDPETADFGEEEARTHTARCDARDKRDQLVSQMMKLPVTTSTDALRKQEVHQQAHGARGHDYDLGEDAEEALAGALHDLRRFRAFEQADAGLKATQAEAARLHAIYAAAEDEESRLYNVWRDGLPKTPPELKILAIDYAFGIKGFAGNARVWASSWVEDLEAMLPDLRERAAKYPDRGSPGLLARAERVIAAFASDRAAVKAPEHVAAHERFLAAQAVAGAASEQASRVEDAVRAAPAFTVAGLAAKARLLLRSYEPYDDGVHVKKFTWVDEVTRTFLQQVIAADEGRALTPVPEPTAIQKLRAELDALSAEVSALSDEHERIQDEGDAERTAASQAALDAKLTELAETENDLSETSCTCLADAQIKARLASDHCFDRVDDLPDPGVDFGGYTAGRLVRDLMAMQAAS